MIQDALAQLQPVESGTDRNLSILIVDDDLTQVESLSHRLRKQGFQTFLAHEGRVGLRKAREHRPDLVLLDLRLPDIDGYSVCEELVDSPDTCDIPIIIVSGSDQEDVVRCSRAAGCRFYVGKPYDPNVLLTLIEHTLQRGCDHWCA